MKDYETHTKQLYNQIQNVWPDNRWYNYTRNNIVSFIDKYKNLFTDESTTINAGSGGSVYDLRGTMYHVDIAENLISGLPNAVVSSIESLPFEDKTFDSAICVGSVINYCSALTDLSELSRVLKPKSFIILEYERSQTGELFFSDKYNKSSIIQQYTYNNQPEHNLWLYSDKYINNILAENGYRIVDNIYFHSISAIVNRFIDNEDTSGKYCFIDNILPSALRKISAHNRILLCERD